MNYEEQMQKSIKNLCDEYLKYNNIDQSLYERFDIKRGLRNKDGSGVVIGLTNVCNVHGYVMNEGEKQPKEGELIYRGYDVRDLVNGFIEEDRFGFEEVVYLLLFGYLPSREQLEAFCEFLAECRELPEDFTEDMILKAPSPNVMNKLARSVLALYSYDDNADVTTLENELGKAIKLISRMPTIMVSAYQVKRRHYYHKSMYFHPIRKEESFAQSILSTLRADRHYTDAEAKLLDLCLILHAEHGGGNNSTFTCRVLTSSGTDSYSAYAGAVSALKGPKHGGANIKVMEMLEYLKEGIKDWSNDDEVEAFLEKMLKKEAGDRSGLIYGMGHAVYTLSDPRQKILKERAMSMAKGTEFEKEFLLLDAVERLTPKAFANVKGTHDVICANVDMYSGLVYKMLGIPQDLYTALFAVARMAGWAAHRMEELTSGGKIIRPAYKAIAKPKEYTKLESR